MIHGDCTKIRLEPDEVIEDEASLSRTGLVAMWISIPAFLLASFSITYLPYFLKIAFSRSFRNYVLDMHAADSLWELNLTGAVTELVFQHVPKVLLALACIPLVLLILAWLGICLFQTSRYFKYSLAITNLRIIAFANGVELNAPLDEIVNVFIEQSLGGRLFRYGDLVISTKRKALTVKHIQNPEHMHKIIMAYAERNVAY